MVEAALSGIFSGLLLGLVMVLGSRRPEQTPHPHKEDDHG